MTASFPTFTNVGSRLMLCHTTALFVEVPHPSISWIYASIGCQHTLQPTSNDFEPPSIPALTTRGFVRWQSIEILLGPEEHVPFIQTAVRNWGIKHPDTGENFPVDLPTEAFPQECDTEIEKWHSACAAKLRQRATPDDDDDDASVRPELPPRPKVRVQAGYTHVHARPPNRPAEYFDPRSRVSSRPLSYSHVSSTATRPVRPPLTRSPTHRAPQFLAPEEPILSPDLARSRRRSFPENLGSSPSSANVSPQDQRPPPVHHHVRRHSHPRHARQASVSSDASSEDDGSQSPKNTANTNAPRRRSHPHSSHSSSHAGDDPPSSTRFNPTAPTSPDPRRERKEREEEIKRANFAIPIDLTGKLSAPFLLGKRDREERAARSGSRGGNKVSWKDLNDLPETWKKSSKESSQDEEPPRRSRDDRGDYKRRERDRDRDRERERDRDRDRDPVRPRLQSRRSRSSNDDFPRRDRYSDRDRERDRDREPIGRDHRSFRDRDRDRRAVSPIRGVDGRRYPAHAI